jgi:acyl-ACP thioesterase
MVFPDRYGVHVDGVVTGHEIALPSPPRRAEGSDSMSFTVPFSYVDLNGHMNNTRYFDLVEDCIGAAAAGKELKEICVEYQNEARLGETLLLRWGEEEGNCFLSGETERPVFRMGLKYK